MRSPSCVPTLQHGPFAFAERRQLPPQSDGFLKNE
jgi:hypothetical protein